MAADPHEALTEHFDHAVSGALPLVQRQLEVVTDHLREAIADYETLRCIEEAGEPGVSGRAGAHRLIAADRWQAALGARAALEAVYQELAGRPSPQHAADARALGDLRLVPNPVGLEGRHPATAAFLTAHATDRRDEALAPSPDRLRPDPGLEL
jgi:hypothetical protein